MRWLQELLSRISKLETRTQNAVRFGVVTHVDPAKQLMRLRLGGTDAKPFLSPWMPYAQTAGAMKIHNPPSVGQQMMAISDGGNMKQAVGMPMTWSNNNQSPSDKGNEHVMTFGNSTVIVKADEITARVGPAYITLTQQKLMIVIGNTSIVMDDGSLTGKSFQFDWFT